MPDSPIHSSHRLHTPCHSLSTAFTHRFPSRLALHLCSDWTALPEANSLQIFVPRCTCLFRWLAAWLLACGLQEKLLRRFLPQDELQSHEEDDLAQATGRWARPAIYGARLKQCHDELATSKPKRSSNQDANYWRATARYSASARHILLQPPGSAGQALTMYLKLVRPACAW